MTTPAVDYLSFALSLPSAKILAWAQGNPPLPDVPDSTPGLAEHAGPLLDLIGRFTGNEHVPALRAAVANGDPAARTALEHAFCDTRALLPAAVERAQQLYKSGEFPQASREGRQIGDLAVAAGDQYGAAIAYLCSARSFWQLQSATSTIDMYLQSIAAADRCVPPPRPLLSACHDNLGLALYSVGRLDEAITHFRTAAQLTTDPDDTLQIRANLALAYQDFGEFDLAAGMHADTVRDLQARHADPVRVAVARDNWAIALFDAGDVAGALPLLEQSAQEFPPDALEDRYRNAISRRTVQLAAGNRERAAAAMREAWQVADTRAHRLDVDRYRSAYREALKRYSPPQSEVWQWFGAAAQSFRDQQWDEAARRYRHAAQLAGQAGDRLTQLRALANAAGVLADGQRVDEARDLALQVRAVALQESLALPVALVDGTLASLFQGGADEVDAGSGTIGRAAEGLAHADLHDLLVSESTLPADHPERRGSIDRGVLRARVAEAASEAGATDLAESLYRQAVESAQRVGYRYGELNRSVGLLTVYDRDGGRQTDADRVATWLRTQLADPAIARPARLVMLRALGARSRDAAAGVVDLRAAADVLETLRAEQPPGAARSDLDREYGVYRSLLRQLVAAGAPDDEAFAALQAMRGRRLMEMLSAGVGATAYVPPTAAEVVELLGRQPRETTLVDVTVTDAGLRVYLVDAAGLRTLDIPGDTTALSVAGWGDARSRAADVLTLVGGSALLSDLAERVTAALRPGSTVLLAVDDALANLPLLAIPVAGVPWSERVSTGRIAAAGVLRYTPPGRSWTGRSLVAGDSNGDLPGAARECTEVARLLGARPLVGAACTVQAVRADLAAPGPLDVVHLAVHGRADVRNGGRASLLFAGTPPEWVSFTDLAALPWRAGLIVFSGCSTAVGGPRNGAGLYGVAQAAAEAGATTVIASLWPVDDESAAFFMTEFYGELAHRRGAGTVDLREVMDQARARLRARLAAGAPGGAAAATPSRDGRDLIVQGVPAPSTSPPDPALQWAAFVLIGEPTLVC